MNLYDILPKTEYNYLYNCGPNTFERVAVPTESSKDCLSFASTSNDFKLAYDLGCRVFVAKKGLKIDDSAKDKILCVEVDSISEAMVKVLKNFDPENFNKLGIDSTSLIHPSSVIDKTSYIGPYTIIEENCRIEANCHIGPFVHIAKGAIIGLNTKIISHCYIGPNTQIGENVKIYPFNSLGSPGFGFHQNKDGSRTRIPQTGKLKSR
jgi:UDP-3-O-[3-hydroxymyristoyl] glucosamine N-acyltransferase